MQTVSDKSKEEYIKDALNSYFSIMEDAHLVLPQNSTFEIYHHYGYKKYREVGTLFIKVVNREYCKSYAVILPGQQYPAHFHKIKQETFYLLFGDLQVVKEHRKYNLVPGEMLDVERLEEHSFSSETGAVFEEISTTYLRNDSIYVDEAIKSELYRDRKTVVTYDEWRCMQTNE